MSNDRATKKALPLAKSAEHAQACHDRWLASRNRKMEDPDYRDEWYREQCGACRFWVALTGTFEEDWGACTNVASRFDGLVRFEHDGCEAYEADGRWG